MAERVAWWLVLIGAINWLLVGLCQWDIGELFGGMDEMVSRIIYILVGLAGVYLLPQAFGVKVVAQKK